MISRNRPVLLVLALLFACAAPGWAQNNCAGGGKPRPDEGGIGGTGFGPVAPEEDDSGIGGTGISAENDTGIIGTITGFASICVGGVEIYYGTNSVVQIDGQPATTAELAVGQVVEVVARGSGNEVSARQLAVHYIVTGPVTATDPERNTLDVIGQTVQLMPGVREAGADADQAASAFQLGDVVQISGMRRGDGVIATSLVRRVAGGGSQLTGPVSRVEPGLLTVGATQIIGPSDTSIAVGDEIRASGRWDGNRLIATAIAPIPPIPFDGRVGHVAIEGFARAVASGQVQVDAFVFELPSTATPPQLVPDARVRIQALIHDRRAIVEHISVLSERPPPPERGAGGLRGEQQHERAGHGFARPEERGATGPHEAQGQRPPRPFDGHSDVGGRPQIDRPEHPERPDRPDRPERVQLPERPPRIERPPLPERAFIPERPPRPDMPPRP